MTAKEQASVQELAGVINSASPTVQSTMFRAARTHPSPPPARPPSERQHITSTHDKTAKLHKAAQAQEARRVSHHVNPLVQRSLVRTGSRGRPASASGATTPVPTPATTGRPPPAPKPGTADSNPVPADPLPEPVSPGSGRRGSRSSAAMVVTQDGPSKPAVEDGGELSSFPIIETELLFVEPALEDCQTWSAELAGHWACSVLRNRFGAPFTDELAKRTVQRFCENFVDGPLLSDSELPLSVWTSLLPEHGLRLVLMEEAKNLHGPMFLQEGKQPSAVKPYTGEATEAPALVTHAVTKPKSDGWFVRSRFSNTPLLDQPFVAPQGAGFWRSLCLAFRWNILKALFYLRTTLWLLTLSDFAVMVLYVLIARLCWEREFGINFSPTIFVSSIIFPLSFSVNSAYQRRELALQMLGNFKAGTLNMYLSTRAWLEDTHLTLQGISLEETFRGLYGQMRDYLQAHDEDVKEACLKEIYENFSIMHAMTEQLRKSKGIEPPILSRNIQDLRFIIEAFEKLRVVADYRTPSSIRVFTKLTITLGAFPFGAYCSHLGTAYSPWALWNAPIAIALVFVLLQNVQRMLENPFSSPDQNDQDDINLNYLRSIDVVSEDTGLRDDDMMSYRSASELGPSPSKHRISSQM
eukprot:NODE_387_length_2011_cov_46.881104_g380_i0.p1 GENE.NODE_387_length_2011_cov_46.881104_g380_i0~~NODE_387_length_2011_cov_46.881104_g380_i0.p1  ORF type:complete len:638 (-),score=71.28 NODE_387_length_2011_cov_46.881104_g380_i0:22-1935(-)